MSPATSSSLTPSAPPAGNRMNPSRQAAVGGSQGIALELEIL